MKTEEKIEEGAEGRPGSGSSLLAPRSSLKEWLALCAMCPLLAVSDTVVNAIGLGLAVLIVAPASAALFAVVRRWLRPEAELPAALLLFAGVLACLELLMRAFFHNLYAGLGVFLPLIAANLALIGALVTQRERPVLNVIETSAAIALMLLVLGVGRELVGRGSLLNDAGLIFGQPARAFELKVFSVDMGFLLGMLPPGAFISLGLLLAGVKWLRRKRLTVDSQKVRGSSGVEVNCRASFLAGNRQLSTVNPPP